MFFPFFPSKIPFFLKKQKTQTYKPSSVGCLHNFLIIYLRPCSRRGCSDLPTYSREPRLYPFQGSVGIFGLATPKVYRAFMIAHEAVRSYRTFSPLQNPCLPVACGARQTRCFCGLFSVALAVALESPRVRLPVRK